MNEQMSEQMNEQMSKWMNDWISKWANVQMNECANKQTNEQMNEWTNNQMNEQSNEWKNKWMRKQMSQWMSKWACEWNEFFTIFCSCLHEKQAFHWPVFPGGSQCTCWERRWIFFMWLKWALTYHEHDSPDLQAMVGVHTLFCFSQQWHEVFVFALVHMLKIWSIHQKHLIKMQEVRGSSPLGIPFQLLDLGLMIQTLMWVSKLIVIQKFNQWLGVSWLKLRDS